MACQWPTFRFFSKITFFFFLSLYASSRQQINGAGIYPVPSTAPSECFVCCCSPVLWQKDFPKGFSKYYAVVLFWTESEPLGDGKLLNKDFSFFIFFGKCKLALRWLWKCHLWFRRSLGSKPWKAGRWGLCLPCSDILLITAAVKGPMQDKCCAFFGLTSRKIFKRCLCKITAQLNGVFGSRAVRLLNAALVLPTTALQECYDKNKWRTISSLELGEKIPNRNQQNCLGHHSHIQPPQNL